MDGIKTFMSCGRRVLENNLPDGYFKKKDSWQLFGIKSLPINRKSGNYWNLRIRSL